MGHGVDVVDVARFVRALARTPSLADRLFTPAERADRPVEGLAARFAAKEAVAKALASVGGRSWAGGWHDVEVLDGPPPTLALRGGVAAAAASVGAVHWHLSLSHDGGVAFASVIASGSSS